MRLVS
jgi:hypothetical protein